MLEAIKEDVKWLGFNWDDRLYHASDYFDQLFEWAKKLIRMEKHLYVTLSFEEMRKLRGNL
jgi:glutaminyl-tRNA synthetase